MRPGARLAERLHASKPGAVTEATKEEIEDFNRMFPGGIVTKERDPLLQERQKTHGDFELNAIISQHLKKTFFMPYQCKDYCYTPDREKMAMIHREALDMIALKLSRILSGQANFKDHWDDIAGYAKLGSEACE